jgi:serine/threonine protein kinase
VPLTWEERLHIALASAIGINYLHDHASPPIIHRDIKSANILLNEKMVAKVADFGLSKLAPDEGQKLVHSVNVKGTMGYLDPEYYMTSDLTDKSDVYSFGVVLLELLTARPPIDQGRFVVREFRNALDKGGIEALRPLLDPALQNISAGDLDPYLKIAMACVEEDSASRPTTAEIVKQLQTLDAISKPKGGVRAMDVEGGAKKVKFADDLNPESEQMDLLSIDMQPTGVPPYPYQTAPDSFRYSGAYGVSTTVKPK